VAARKLEDEDNMARERVRAAWAIAVAALCWAGAAHAQTTSLDREVKAAPGREVRVYTSMRADCTAGPLPAIRLSVVHGTLTVQRATIKATNVKQCLAAELPALVAFYRAKANSGNEDRFELEVSSAAGRKQIQRFHVIISNGEGQRI
jgi:hypothetical protein